MNATSGDGSLRHESANRSPEDIEADIDRTRAALDSTLDALQSRLSVRRRFNSATLAARQKGERLLHSGVDALTPSITTMIRLDHTHVLALFRRFKPQTPPGKKRALVASACLALEVHAQLEEQVFYPALRAVIGADEVLDKSVTEHDEMRQILGMLQAMEPGHPNYDGTFRALMRVVLHHVADEETTLLPLAEERLGAELRTLGREMTRRRLELLKPHLAEVAMTTARSFPLASAAAVGGFLAIGWLLVRPNGRRASRGTRPE
jgi:hemerythrin superfamily protein